MSALEEVSRRTGELVILAAPAGIVVQYIHVIPATNPVRMHLRTGAVRPMTGSAAGHLFLSARPDDRLEAEIERLEAAQSEPLIARDELMKQIRRIRRRGYAISTNTVTPGGGIVALLLPGEFNERQLAIGIGGVADVITANEQRFVSIMREAVARHIEPLLARAG